MNMNMNMNIQLEVHTYTQMEDMGDVRGKRSKLARIPTPPVLYYSS